MVSLVGLPVSSAWYFRLILRPSTPPWALTASKYACTPFTTWANCPASGPDAVARLPTVIDVGVTPGAVDGTLVR